MIANGAALEIRTDGWVDVHCDKCNSVTSFDPTVPFDAMRCLGCAPLIGPGEALPVPNPTGEIQ